jgi:hypothetical protein
MSGFLYGQQLNVISTGASYTETAEGSLSFTIGETVINTIESPNNHITQGFNQDWIHFASTNTFKENFNISVFPNPTTHYINVESDKPSDLKIYDLNGKEVLNTKINKTKKVDLTQLSPGTYFLKFIQENLNVKTIKIIIL